MEDDDRLRRREAARRRTRRQRWLALLALVAAVVAVGGIAVAASSGGSGAQGGDRATGIARGDSAEGKPRPKPKPKPKPPELPRGGTEILPRYRVVAFYGAPQDEALGVLGIGSLTRAGRKLKAQAREYRRGGRPIMPAFELIATVAAGAPGEDQLYRYRQEDKVIREHLRAARRARALLLLDIQPGRAPFMDEVRHLRRWLKEPDVSLAIDPEWSMTAGQIPGQQIGSTDATVINRVSAYMADIVRRGKLPQKLLLVHQFTDDMIRNKEDLKRRKDVALVLNVDGFGTPANKISKYKAFTDGPRRTHYGYKLFYEEDTDLMSPSEVLDLRPRPDVVEYE